MTPLDRARQAIADYDDQGTMWSSKELIEIIRALLTPTTTAVTFTPSATIVTIIEED